MRQMPSQHLGKIFAVVAVGLVVMPLGATNLWFRSSAEDWGRFDDASRWFTDKGLTQAYGAVASEVDKGRGAAWIDLRGRAHQIGSWPADHLQIRNGRLSLSQTAPTSRFTIGAGAEMLLKCGSFVGNGMVHPGANLWTVEPGGKLTVSCEDVKLQNLKVVVKEGGEYTDRFGRGLEMHCNRGENAYYIDCQGKVNFPIGLFYSKCQWGYGAPVLHLHPSGEVVLGGSIDQNGNAAIRWRLAGGKLHITKRLQFNVQQLKVLKDAVVTIEVDQGVLADLSCLEADPSGKVIKKGKGTLILGEKPAQLEIAEGKVEYKSAEERKLFDWRFHDILVDQDTANRCFYLNLEPYRKHFSAVTYTYPNHEVKGGFESVRTASSYFRRRFPEGVEKPFIVRARIETSDGRVVEKEVTVTPHSKAKVFRPPFANHEMLVGICAYQRTDLIPDMITNRIGNVIALWSKSSPGAYEKDLAPEVFKQAKKDGMNFLTIYGWDSANNVRTLEKTWGQHYLYNNIGEYCGFLYQGPPQSKQVGVPGTNDLVAVRDWLINDWCFKRQRRHVGANRFIYSTSGSPLANYELAGGIEMICNELWAVGSAHLAYATAEARGAARRWKPAYWCSWHAHDWQTWAIPYNVPMKYKQLMAGLLQQYVMGTSMIVLESGAETTQAWQHTALEKGNTNRVVQTYHDYGPQNYRRTMKAFYDFTRKNPRDKGAPDTSIALVLGHCDSYVGQLGPWLAAFGNHKVSKDHPEWGGCAPEKTWGHVRYPFFPCGEALKPYGNGQLAGSPYGQVDIVGVDDEARYSDIARYKLLAYAGWNTMTPQAMRVLERYVRNGGQLVLALPHLSTRTDRKHDAQLQLEDLYQLDFAGITVTGKVTTSSKQILAALQLGKGVEIHESLDGQPLFVKAKLGKGTLWFFTAWNYIGDNRKLADRYTKLLRTLAAAVPQRVTVNPTSPDAYFICYAAYGRKAYFLNLDCNNPRKAQITFANGTTREIEIPPCSIETVDIPRKLRRDPIE